MKLFDNVRSFLFKCEDCGVVVSVPFEDPEDYKKIQNDEIVLECPCNGECFFLRD